VEMIPNRSMINASRTTAIKMKNTVEK